MTIGIADFIRDLQISGGGKGLNPLDKQALIDIANSADANNDTIKTDVVNKLKTMNPALTITTASDWAAIRAAIATMPNNGSLIYTPGTAPRSIPSGYTSGGTVDGDPDLVPANIKSGANIFGVAGKNEVLDTTTGAGAAAADVLTGKEVFVNGTKRVGTMPNRGANQPATGTALWPDGALAAYMPQGWYGGGVVGANKEAELKITLAQMQAAEGDLIAANILSGKNIFGLVGTVQPGKQVFSGQVTASGQDVSVQFRDYSDVSRQSGYFAINFINVPIRLAVFWKGGGNSYGITIALNEKISDGGGISYINVLNFTGTSSTGQATSYASYKSDSGSARMGGASGVVQIPGITTSGEFWKYILVEA